jgi:VWFA-related protein
VAATLLLLAALGGSAAGAAEPPLERAPGLVERTRATLLLLEVEAVDRKGRRMPGLAREDFVVRLDGRLWPVATLDDLCAATSGAPGGPPAPGDVPGGGEAGRSDRFILFFDFNQLALAGRFEALREAGRWVAETKRPDDEAMLAAYGAKIGLVVLQEFTRDRGALAAALDRIAGDRRAIDHFPIEFITRWEECDEDPGTCIHHARQEYWNGRQSLTAIRALLARLEEVPGRKHLIVFHQNGMLLPGQPYGADGGDHVALTNEIGAEATASRTAIHTARVGGAGRVEALEPAARTLGVRLAEATGGRYNRGASDLRTMLAEAGSRGRCLYLLGLEPPEPPSRRIYTAKVVARGVTLPALPQIRFRTEEDRWLRKASAVLERPGEARDVPLAAAIVPLRAARGLWTVAVRVAIDEEALVELPAAGRSRGEWDVGAVLQATEGRGKWEMLGRVTLARPTSVRTRPVLVHEREFAGLRPGDYRLTAFVRDRVANLFGGAEALLSLPDPRDGGAAGPILVRPGRPRIVSVLPLLGDRGTAGVTGRRDAGPVPSAATALARGEDAEILSWICPGRDASPGSPRRLLAMDEVPISRLPEASLLPAGDCFLVDDSIPTAALGPGRYTYELLWERPGGLLRLEHPIEVIAPLGSGDD